MKKIAHKLHKFIGEQITYIENVSMTPVSFATAFLSIVLIRIFIENFSNPDQYGLYTEWSTIIAYLLFYIAALLTIVLFITPFTGKKITTVIRYGLFFTILLNISPVVDLIVTGGTGYCMGYSGAHHFMLLETFFNFFGPLHICGVTFGMKFEIVVMMLGIFFLCYLGTKKIWKGIIGALAGYSAIWIHLSMQGILMTLDPRTFDVGSIEAYYSSIYTGSFLSSIHSFFAFQVPQLFHYFEFIALFTDRLNLWITIIILLIIFWKYDKQKVKAFISNMRLERIGFYLLFVCLGIKIAYWLGFVKHIWSLTDVFGFITLALVVALNFLLAVIINDREDVVIDSKSNIDRPLIQKTLSDVDMKHIAQILAILVLMGSFMFNYNIFILLFSFQMMYYIYSVPPLRLRRLFPINIMLIGLISTFALLIGYFFVSQHQEIISFPKSILLMFFLFITSIASTKDLKDESGDREDGVTTLTTLVGRKKARLITGFIMLAWLLFFIFIALSYSFVIAVIYCILFLCVAMGLLFTQEGERGGFVIFYLLIIPLFFL